MCPYLDEIHVIRGFITPIIVAILAFLKLGEKDWTHPFEIDIAPVSINVCPGHLRSIIAGGGRYLAPASKIPTNEWD